MMQSEDSTQTGRASATEPALPFFISVGPPDLVGEFLRWQTFVGEGFGCYGNFNVRDDARRLTDQQLVRFWCGPGHANDREQAAEWADLGEGHVFTLDGMTVVACWFWDGDGNLDFLVHDDGKTVRLLSNGDCKKDYGWCDLAEDA